MEKKTTKKQIKKESLFSSFQREIDNEKLEHDIFDDETSIRETCKSDEQNTTINLDTNLNGFNDECDVMLKAFDDAFETIYGDNEVGFIQVQQLSEELQSNCVHLINMVKTQKNTTEIEQLKSKYTLMENESLTTIKKLQFQVTELKIQLKQQSTFSSNIGSTFGYNLWKATQIPTVVDMVLREDKITNMAKIFTSVLSSFVETYNNQMPPVKTCETKFVLDILGIVANLTTSKSGCHFFTQISDGINVVNLIVSLVPYIPYSLKHNLKKIAYAALYNVSIQFNGHLLMENHKLIETLQNDLKVTTNKDINDTLLFSLKLLHSLTRNMNESMCIIVKNEINLQEILKLARYTETEFTARKIYENINFAIEKYSIKFE